MEQRNLNIGLLIFRLNMGVWMLFHGVHKVFNGVDHIKGMLAGMGLPTFLAYGVHLGETIAPILLIIGFRTKLAALAFTIVMLVAFALAHVQTFFAFGNSGAWAHETIALFIMGALGLVFTGGGKYAVSSSHKWD